MFQAQAMPTIVPKIAGHSPKAKISERSAKSRLRPKDCENAESEVVGNALTNLYKWKAKGERLTKNIKLQSI